MPLQKGIIKYFRKKSVGEGQKNVILEGLLCYLKGSNFPEGVTEFLGKLKDT